ncbi:hypothetical protein DX933_16585 [Ornithinibacillus gellani]|uniref:hypothetical protein n=1 Tax=Ornithinibacillus gellani TaxID=2293253 RepID=UPI000F4A56FD|nr:hypothetical protein [Ornithinibacillus gellani]TQS70981.1 hypothetical protein DX933_16585 [Ornithinibacillus gellani]
MSNYLKLVNFELSRFMKLYVVMICFTIIMQITGVIVKSKSYMGLANEEMYKNMMSKTEFINQHGEFSFYWLTQSIWFMGPIALCGAALLFYMFLIWYRDWLGKNTFIYRLLMIPTARMNVYLAKATTIFLMVIGMVALQLALFPVEAVVMQWMVPVDFRLDLNILQTIFSLNFAAVLFPLTPTEFFLWYGAGAMSILVIFTAILFERSFRWKGILIGVVYIALSVGLLMLPVLIDEFFMYGYLYPIELVGITIVMGLLVTGMSLFTSHYLLNKKVTV